MGQVVPADFLGFIETPLPNMAHETVLMEGAAVSHHDELMANFFAQASCSYMCLEPYVPACNHTCQPAAIRASALC